MTTSFATIPNYNQHPLHKSALWLAKDIAYADLDIEAEHIHLMSFAIELDLHIPKQETPFERLQHMTHAFIGELGFQGNLTNYYDPRNSFLNEVLRRKVGIPISLAVVFITIGRELGFDMFGVGLPAHYVVGCRLSADQICYVDLFSGEVLPSKAACIAWFEATFQPADNSINWDHYFEPQANWFILARMLLNLQNIYTQQENIVMLTNVMALRRALAPTDYNLARDLAILYSRIGKWGLAVRHFRDYRFYAPAQHITDEVDQLMQIAHQKYIQMN